jgi:anti-anti-sigma factor
VELRESLDAPPARGRSAEAVVLNLHEGTAVLVLLGEHDIGSEKRLRAQMVSLIADYPLVVVDLSHIEFFDSSCLNLVLGAHKQAAATGHRLVLQTGENHGARRLLEITGLLDHIDCVFTRAEALAREAAASGPPTADQEAADNLQGDVHVINRSTGWRLEIDGSGRVHSTFPTQQAAWEAGKALARRKQRTALLHARAGGVREIYDGRQGFGHTVATSATDSKSAERRDTQ